ncbi:MAG: hypothetical protein L6V85_02320 [Clostridiales bacterium]|nr:MAG: hypothetical protein L6V85_02320 [Clostridiales bacterium]
MVISFFGHKDYYYDDAVKAAAYSFVRKVAKGQVSFFVGCYGGFDKMSYDLAERFKKEVDSTAKIVFVTPYLDEKYLLYKTEIVPFDEVLYPPLESVPKKTVNTKNATNTLWKKIGLYRVFLSTTISAARRRRWTLQKEKGKSFINLAEKNNRERTAPHKNEKFFSGKKDFVREKY